MLVCLCRRACRCAACVLAGTTRRRGVYPTRTLFCISTVRSAFLSAMLALSDARLPGQFCCWYGDLSERACIYRKYIVFGCRLGRNIERPIFARRQLRQIHQVCALPDQCLSPCHEAVVRQTLFVCTRRRYIDASGGSRSRLEISASDTGSGVRVRGGRDEGRTVWTCSFRNCPFTIFALEFCKRHQLQQPWPHVP